VIPQVNTELGRCLRDPFCAARGRCRNLAPVRGSLLSDTGSWVVICVTRIREPLPCRAYLLTFQFRTRIAAVISVSYDAAATRPPGSDSSLLKHRTRCREECSGTDFAPLHYILTSIKHLSTIERVGISLEMAIRIRRSDRYCTCICSKLTGDMAESGKQAAYQTRRRPGTTNSVQDARACCF
jgi:hypothetical protein